MLTARGCRGFLFCFFFFQSLMVSEDHTHHGACAQRLVSPLATTSEARGLPTCYLQREKPLHWEARESHPEGSLHSNRDPTQPQITGRRKEKEALQLPHRQLQAHPGLPPRLHGFSGPTGNTASSAHAHQPGRSETSMRKTSWLSDCKPAMSATEECSTRNVTLLPRKAQRGMWRASCPGL